MTTDKSIEGKIEEMTKQKAEILRLHYRHPDCSCIICMEKSCCKCIEVSLEKGREEARQEVLKEVDNAGYEFTIEHADGGTTVGLFIPLEKFRTLPMKQEVK